MDSPAAFIYAVFIVAFIISLVFAFAHDYNWFLLTAISVTVIFITWLNEKPRGRPIYKDF